MIAADHDRRLDLSRLHEMVDSLAEESALTISQPADPRRQALKSHFLTREVDPSIQNFVLRKQLQNEIVCQRDVARVSRERDPAKRPAAFRKHRTDVCGNESWTVIGVLHTAFVSHRPD